MMTVTKISLILIIIVGVAFAVFGSKIFRPVLHEKDALASPSLSPEANYFVAPYQKAKNVQELENNRFTNSASVTK